MAKISNASNDLGYREAYNAAIKGESDTLLKFCSQHPTARINASGDTVFHILALNCHAKVVDELLLKLPTLHDLMMVKNADGDTVLHEAARLGCLEIAKLLLQKEANLITARNKFGETPIFVAAAFGQKKMLQFVSEKPNCENGLRRNDGSTILHAAVMGEFYGIPMDVCTAIKEDLENPQEGGMGIHGQPQNYWQRVMKQSFKPLLRSVPCLKRVVDVKQKHKDVLELVNKLVARESTHCRLNYYINHCEDPDDSSASGWQWNKYKVLTGMNSNEDPLLQAMKCGIIEVVQAILKVFPDAVEVRDKNGKNIFHIVAEYCQDEIFELLLKSKNVPMKKMLVEVDKEGNTLLHLAAKYGFYQHKHMLLVLHQMPWELFWFKKIKYISPKHAYYLQNEEGKTPKELFDETHHDPLKQSMKVVKESTGATLVVAILMVTLMFTAALTIPGGFNTDSDSNSEPLGLPILPS